MGEGLSYPKILIKKEQGDLIPLEGVALDIPENVLRVVGDCLERDETKRPRDLTVVLEKIEDSDGSTKDEIDCRTSNDSGNRSSFRRRITKRF